MSRHRPVRRTASVLDPDGLWRGLQEALDAPGRVDRVELKVLLDCRLEDAMSVLGAKVKPPVLRTIHYLDTPDRALSSSGVVVRTRVSRAADGAGEGAGDVAVGDVVVKVRRPGPARTADSRPGACPLALGQVPPGPSPRLAEAVRELITDHGIALSERQASKTHISCSASPVRMPRRTPPRIRSASGRGMLTVPTSAVHTTGSQRTVYCRARRPRSSSFIKWFLR
jgi:hypothetical protein